MASSLINSQAKNNGNESESLTPAYLDKSLSPELRVKIGNVEYIDELVDFYSENGIPIEVKSCQEFQARADNYGLKRLGRFVLSKDQHNYLLHKQGYYFFIVKAGSLVLRAKLIKAEDITYQRLVLWRPIWE